MFQIFLEKNYRTPCLGYSFFLFSTPNTIGIICGGFHNKDTLPINKNLLLCKRRHDSQNVQAQFEHDDIMIHPGKIVLFFTAMDPIIST